jgi:hypothetical protein
VDAVELGHEHEKLREVDLPFPALVDEHEHVDEDPLVLGEVLVEDFKHRLELFHIQHPAAVDVVERVHAVEQPHAVVGQVLAVPEEGARRVSWKW